MTSTPEVPEGTEPEHDAAADAVEPERAAARVESENVAAADAVGSEPDEAAPPAAAQAVVPDERLLVAHDIARAALHEVTAPATVGEAAGYTTEPDGVVSLRFANRMLGYPGWFWTVSVAVVEGAEPTVLEVELLPGDDALLAPEWVPWAVRLAEYQAQQTAAAADDAEGEASDFGVDDESDDDDPDDAGDDDLDEDDLDEDELDEDLDGVEDLDASDFDEDGSPILHSGDLDGVDIDQLDDSAGEDERSEED